MDQLLSAARRILDRGQPLTMALLASEAGMSRATAYRRSGGKEAVLQALEAQGVDLPAESPTRERILEAVRGQIAHHGLLATSMESLAEEVGVHPVTIYRLFGDRETLLREAMATVFPAVSIQLFREQEVGVEEVLQRVGAGLIQFISNFPGLVAQLLVPASGERQELMRLHGLQADLITVLQSWLERKVASGELPDGDPVERSGAFVGLCVGATFVDLDGPLSVEEARRRAERVVERFLAVEG